jgi:hypothetical protein
MSNDDSKASTEAADRRRKRRERRLKAIETPLGKKFRTLADAAAFKGDERAATIWHAAANLADAHPDAYGPNGTTSRAIGGEGAALVAPSPSLPADVQRLYNAMNEVRDAVVAVVAPQVKEDGSGSFANLLADVFQFRRDAALTATPAPPRRKKARVVPPSLQPVDAGMGKAKPSVTDGDLKLGRAERSLLGVLVVRSPEKTTDLQLSILSGYSRKSSSFANALSALRSAGLISGKREGLVSTTHGDRVATDWVQPLPGGDALLEYWKGKLGRAERSMLDAFRSAYPGAIGKEILSDVTGYSLTSSSFANALSRLRSLGLVVDMKLSKELVDE